MKVKEWEKIFHANSNEKRSSVATLLTDKMDLKSNTIKNGQEGHTILIKVSIHQEDIIIIYIYALNSRATNYMKQTLAELCVQ